MRFILFILLLPPLAYAVPQASTAEIEQLLREAQNLYASNRAIDARAKWQKALALAPKDYRPYMMLGAYYLGEEALFKLAYQYITKSYQLFTEKYGDPNKNELDPSIWSEHARLLYLLSEAHLNLDNYQKSLDTLDQFAKLYWQDWLPGTRAWVLWKLKRNKEAIEEAQLGLLRGAEPGRTYNILGILLSATGNRPLAIGAFDKAIKAELALGPMAQVATPLNNAGEVYNEMFKDELAEISWRKSLSLPDGCEHILPSLNLARLYIDELRLFQAQRVLNDFQACFANHAVRSDSEHRALLSLYRGRILLRSGDIDKALKTLTSAYEQGQWFGKIGTTKEDMEVAALVSLAQALEAKAAVLNDRLPKNFREWIANLSQRQILRTRAWWLERRAREVAIDKLSDFEDLFIRNTDAMFQYPTLGSAIRRIDKKEAIKKLTELQKSDKRSGAHRFYKLYLADNLIFNGEDKDAEKILLEVQGSLRSFDRLLKAETLAKLIKAKEKQISFWDRNSNSIKLETNKLQQELFETLGSHIRYYDLALPVEVRSGKGFSNNYIRKKLLATRFSDDANSKFQLFLLSPKKNSIQLALYKKGDKRPIISIEKKVTNNKQEKDLINKFIAKVFSHRVDPPEKRLPNDNLLNGLPL